mmetsp:Transcript_2631/g.6215  ORF Transcript_2631/g.6215 Transcript_2631/m.6215 type:complete len:313 (-) Transcript_2631:31-969(-)
MTPTKPSFVICCTASSWNTRLASVRSVCPYTSSTSFSKLRAISISGSSTPNLTISSLLLSETDILYTAASIVSRGHRTPVWSRLSQDACRAATISWIISWACESTDVSWVPTRKAHATEALSLVSIRSSEDSMTVLSACSAMHALLRLHWALLLVEAFITTLTALTRTSSIEHMHALRRCSRNLVLLHITSLTSSTETHLRKTRQAWIWTLKDCLSLSKRSTMATSIPGLAIMATTLQLLLTTSFSSAPQAGTATSASPHFRHCRIMSHSFWSSPSDFLLSSAPRAVHTHFPNFIKPLGYRVVQRNSMSASA